jgi:hypothetical protein
MRRALLRGHGRPGTHSRRALAATLALTLAVTVAACSDAEDPNASPSPSGVPGQLKVDPNSKLGLPALIGLEPILQEETIVVDAAKTPIDTVEILNPDACDPDLFDRAKCDYRITFATLPTGTVAGSVLVAGVSDTTPAGFLVKVTGVDGNAVLATEATLGDALFQGEFLVEQEFTPADVTRMVVAEGVTPTGETALAAASLGSMGAGAPTAKPALAATVLRDAELAQAVGASTGGGLAFGYSLDHFELAEGLYADGSVSFDASCGAYGGLTWETVWDVPVYPNGAYFEAKCGVTQDGSITVSSEISEEMNYAKKVAEIELATITFFVGPVPIVLVPQVEIYVNASGKVTASMSFGAAEYFHLMAGINYNDGFHLIKDFGADFSSTASLGTGRLSARAGVEARQSLLLYGLVGPQMIEELYLDLQGKPPGERPIWCLDGGLKASVSINVDLGIKDLRWGPGELFDWDEELACAGNSTPTVKWSTSASSHIVYPASTSAPPSLTAFSDDLEEGPRPISWSSSIDGALGTSTSGQAFSLKNLSIGEHVITATTTDSDGASASITVPVSARVASATLDIQIKDANGNFASGSQVSGLTGTTATVRLVSTSPIGIQVSTCLPTTWSGGLTVKSLGGCDYQISLNTAGTYNLTATAKDPDGNTATDTLTVKVTAPAAGSPPAFSEIQATNSSTGGNALCDGCSLGWGETASLMIWYVNYAQAAKAVRYEWDMTTKPSGLAVGPWTAISGSDGTPNSSSWRSFTAPEQFAKSYTYTFRVRVYDKNTNALLYTDTHVLTYSGPPA